MILEFDSLEEFFEYSARMQPLPAQVTASQSLVSTSANEAVQSSATQLQPPKALKPKKSTLRKPLPSYKTSTFKPPVGMLKKVQQFIAENRAFKTANGNRKVSQCGHRKLSHLKTLVVKKSKQNGVGNLF